MGAHPIDSVLYGQLASTPELRRLFDDQGRVQSCLKILAALAQAQAQVGVVPESAATLITDHADVRLLDLDKVAAATRATGHSTLGLVQCLQDLLPDSTRQWVHFGAAVQDMTHTWTALVMLRVGDVLGRDLQRAEAAAAALAKRYRDTVISGRPDGQQAMPITYGLRTAEWASELGRHRTRLAAGRGRWEAVRLSGRLGTPEVWGDGARSLLHAFADRLGLSVPDVPWATASDGVAEFLGLLTMITATLAKIGREIFELSRPEMDAQWRVSTSGPIAGIGIPRTRDLESCEHLITLARVVRASTAVAVEAMVEEPRHDGSAWEAVCLVLPEACQLTGAALVLGCDLLEELETDAQHMQAEVDARGQFVLTGPVMRALADRLGVHAAHQYVYEAAVAGLERGIDFRKALLEHPRIAEHLESRAG
ncbi:MAG: adenylosuccinate lyase [Pseudonocardiales bacterium]|nr:adenylosuccinate lyase [Pseudonocardiales bacterium]